MRMFNPFKKNRKILNEIGDRQFFDIDGYDHMQHYYSFYDKLESKRFDSAEVSPVGLFEFQSLLDVPRYSDESHWETAFGPDRYSGGLTSFVVDKGVQRIGNYAFAYNLNLESIVLPESLLEIGEYAFDNCRKLRHVTLPSLIETIGEHAFDSELNELKLLSTTPPRIKDLGVGPGCKIMIPHVAEEQYRKEKKWMKYFVQIVWY